MTEINIENKQLTDHGGTVADMFNEDDDNSQVMQTMSDLAEAVLVKTQVVKDLTDELKEQSKLCSEMKTQLAELMQANNCRNGHKFDNGLYPKPYTNTKIFKAAGVTDEDMHKWLANNELGDIIKPTVNWQTMNAALKKAIETGTKLPEIFNVTTEQTMKFVGNGHIKFLEGKGQDGTRK